MPKEKPAWFDEVEAYKQELQEKALVEVNDQRAAKEKAAAKSRKARDVPARGFGRRGVD